MRTLFRRPRPAPPAHLEPEAADDALLAMSSALLASLEVRNDELDLAGHAVRVAELADRLAASHGVSEALRDALRQAALLHEVGMIGVPRELLHATEPLTPAELARVHAHAEVGAAIVRAAGGELAALLVRHQYDDEPTLRERLGEGSDAYELTLILRAADVADVLSRARPAAASPISTRRRSRRDDGIEVDDVAAVARAEAFAG